MSPDVFDKCRWLLLVIGKLWKEKFTGDLILHFEDGNVSKKYRRQITEVAPE